MKEDRKYDFIPAGRRWILVILVTWTSLAQAQLPAVSFHHLKRDIDLITSTYDGLAQDADGFIWFGSNDGGGLYRYDGYNLKAFNPDPMNMEKTITGSKIFNVNTEIDSLIIIATASGFTIMNRVTGRIRNYNNQVDSLKDWKIGANWNMLMDSVHQTLWLGTRYGLGKLSLETNEGFILLTPKSPLESTQQPDDIFEIFMDPSNHELLWMVSFHGLFSYHIQEDVYKHYSIPELGSNTISELYVDPNGMIWLGSHAGIVYRFNPITNQAEFRTLPLPSDPNERLTIFEIFSDQQETWVCTQTAVGRLNFENGQFEAWHYDPSYPDGLLPNGMYRDMLIDRHGRLWIASWHGVQFAKQGFMTPNANVKKLKVAITDVDAVPVYDNEDKPLLYESALFLRKEQRDVTFQYVLPNPLDRSAVEYQYMLKGYDKDWINTDQRRVRYPRLGGGEYVFSVRAREGADKEWTGITTLEVRVSKKLAEFWWFWAIIIGAAAVSAIFLYRILISRAKQKERLKADFEHRLSEIQMQALRAQMNPHFLFNSLNSIKYYAISKSKDETAAYLSKFALLVRAILNNSKNHTISLKDELDALRLYIEIEHLRLEGKFDFQVDIDSNIQVGQTQVPPMIFQPYVENAIWHGLMHKKNGKGKLLVQVKDMGNQIQCIIEDNGVGRAHSAALHKKQMDHKDSVGMQITSNRIELINRIYGINTQVHVIDLVDPEGSPSGTRVVINIPMIRDEEE